MKKIPFILGLAILILFSSFSTEVLARWKGKKELKLHFLGMQIDLPDSSLAAFSFFEAQSTPLPPLLTGFATWYGPGFHRRKTANGERYNMNAKTCASPTLPFDTWIEITNTENGKKTIARVNDRLPPRRKSVILDASYGIARELDFVKKGKAKIEIRKIDNDHHDH